MPAIKKNKKDLDNLINKLNSLQPNKDFGWDADEKYFYICDRLGGVVRKGSYKNICKYLEKEINFAEKHVEKNHLSEYTSCRRERE